MTSLRVFVDAIAFWTPSLPGWPIARAAIRGEGGFVEPAAKRPAPDILAAAERRRAPDSVALALEVAAAAQRESGRDPSLASVFTSAHGDLAVSDYMCATLASQPALLSPTRFHNSVHNAAAGYWTIGTGCMAASSALTAFQQSFAASLLEAATQCVADDRAILLVAFDVQSVGPLATVTHSAGLLAAAFVLAPESGPLTRAAFDLALVAGPSTPVPLRSAAARSLQRNAMADALPFLEMLALASAESLALPLSRSLARRLSPRPWH